MAKRRLDGARTILTGASSGIGYALALELARHRARSVVVARREDRLHQLAEAIRSAGGEVELVVGDVTDPLVRRRLLEVAVNRYGGLDVLINNAGMGAFGPFDQATPERLRRVMEVNFFALAELTRAAVPLLKQGRKPIIVNISSVLGHRAVPGSSEYCASKFAVQGLSEALRVELRPYGIDLLVVCPGLTRTEFTANAIQPSAKPDWPAHPGVTPEYVARKTVQAVCAGQREIMPFAWGKVLCWLNWIAPSWVDRFLARFV